MNKLALLLLAVTACPGMAGAAEPKAKLGIYSGTVTLSGTELGRESVNYRASLKIRLPLTDATTSMGIAELADIETPSASATITQWDLVGKNATPDSDGKFTSWTCALAAPTEVPMNGQGTLNVDHRAKTHSMAIALVSVKPIPLKCVNSRSGPYKKEQSISLFFGTNEPDVMPWKGLPFKDATQLTAKHKLVPVSAMKGRHGPLDQEWDLRLAR